MTKALLLLLIVLIKTESSQNRPVAEKVATSPLRHIARELENPLSWEPEDYSAEGGDLKILHSPCEFDLLRALQGSIDYFPKHCQPIYQNRYVNEDWYRLYRTYDAEGFVFGQFAERLRRYEIDSV
ncbi:uncharacterized protein [Drosophila tropicalis]|uniref:uncharacterized protein n=1 Tax=Drosophila tropicalis TaxID=46794 RepID=UPI0035ABF7AC